MFAYCNNNPVMLTDSSGSRPIASTSTRTETKAERSASCAYMNENAIVYKDLTTELDDIMQNHAEKLENIITEKGKSIARVVFFEKVFPGHEWDLKEQDEWKFNPKYDYYYAGRKLRYDDIGNIHYGYVGSVCFGSVLFPAAGAMQILCKTSSWDYRSTFFDDPRDQKMIAFGIQRRKLYLQENS